MRHRKFLLIASAISFTIALTASLGYSQGSGSATSSSSNANAGSASEANAPTSNDNNVTITMPSTTVPQSHQLIQAAPGPIPGMFPGSASGQIVCGMYHPKVSNLKYLSPSAIASMAKGGKLPHGVKVILIDPVAAKATTYNGLIGVMEYDPLGDDVNDGDIVLAGVKWSGNPEDINEGLIGVTAKALRKIAPAMQRVAIGFCFYPAEDTKTKSKGIGAVASGSNGSGQVGTSASVGLFSGDSITKQQRVPGITVYALNGPYNLLTPPLPKPKQDEGAATKKVTPAPQSPPPTEPPAAPREAPAPQVQAPPPPSPITAAPPAAVTTAPVDECRNPPVAEVHFGYDCDSVFDRCIKSDESVGEWKARSESNRQATDVMKQWLREHPHCNVQVEGSACHHGKPDYNAGLGLRRAHAVFSVLIEDEKIKSQVFQSDSNGKDNAGMGSRYSERNKEDRKVIIVVRGDDSSDPAKK